ncbi:hypothetical protein [Streptosporangium roseum]|uniref:hypothetical protein n=1 Tax=Streptosporangium roseum TaxID=2001 RepID=UPI00341BE41B
MARIIINGTTIEVEGDDIVIGDIVGGAVMGRNVTSGTKGKNVDVHVINGSTVISGDGAVIVNGDNHGGIGRTFGGKKPKKKA